MASGMQVLAVDPSATAKPMAKWLGLHLGLQTYRVTWSQETLLYLQFSGVSLCRSGFTTYSHYHDQIPVTL